MGELFDQIKDVFLNLFRSDELMKILGQPQMMLASFVALNMIIFTETGLLVGFFLPGDSLLVVAGNAARGANWPISILLVTLCLAAIIGDTVGYAIGRRLGPSLYSRPNSLFFHKSHLQAAQDFYARHGGKTIVLARFMPLIRTFAPVVAGAARMEYGRFVAFNVLGGVGWVCSMVLLGYFLESVFDPFFRLFLGADFTIRKHMLEVSVVIVLISVSPMFIAWLKARSNKKKSAIEPMKFVA
ncbi:MAG: VTT domain-containing protein [Gemmataceae bacterium]|nr:VTT domain-containing protein [Gemmataceae bacterium]